MTVYVAVKGENGEGFYILSIHKNEADAIAACLKQEACFSENDYNWKPVANRKNSWINGCDYVEVQEHTVQ